MMDQQVPVAGALQWRKWLIPGVVLSVLVTGSAVLVRSGAIRADLEARGKAKLVEDGQGWASVSVSGRDAVVSGTAPSVAAQRLAIESAGRLLGLRRVVDDTGLIPVASPFVWIAERRREGLVLAGSAPDPATVGNLRDVAAAVGQGTSVRDRTLLARGAPRDFSSAAEFGLRALGRLAEGRVEIRDTQLSITGAVADRAAFEALPDQLARQAPAGFRLALDIQPPLVTPYVWKGVADGGRLAISGYVPSRAVKTALAANTAAAWPKGGVNDTTTLASGAPAGFQAATEFALAALARMGAGEANLDGLALRLSGRAKTVDDHEALLAMFAGPLPAGLALNDVSVTPAIVSPYFFRVEKNGGELILSGYMPSVDARRSIVAHAGTAQRGATVTDKLRIADGAPRMDWIGAAKFALDETRKLTKGFAAVNGQAYDLSGEAASSEAFGLLRGAAVGVLPASLKLGKLDIAPPSVSPYRLSALAEGGKLVLEGYVPTGEAREALLARSKRKFAGTEIVDRLAFASGQPANFDPVTEASLQALSRLTSGRLEIVGTAVTIGGAAPYPGSADRIESDLTKALPSGFEARTQFTSPADGAPLPAAGCNDGGKAILSAAKIEFGTGTASLLIDGYGVLDRLIAVLRRCPDAKVEIGGHTDSEGGPAANLTLSKSRAEAVVAYLASAGILRERLSAVGYGESRPIASNGTEDGRAQNRRIEISVQE